MANVHAIAVRRPSYVYCIWECTTSTTTLKLTFEITLIKFDLRGAPRTLHSFFCHFACAHIRPFFSLAIHIVPVRPRRSGTIAVNCVLAYAAIRQESCKLQQQIGISKLGIKSTPFSLGLLQNPPSTSDRRSSPLHTWPPHHSGAHRSDTPTRFHSFGRHPIPPRAYTLHQERSKQEGKRRTRASRF